MKSFAQFLALDDIYTYSARNDAERFAIRLRALRSGLVALLTSDAELDDALLRQHGITKWDTTEDATDAVQDAATLRRTPPKHAALVVPRRTVQRDGATSGSPR